MVRLVQLNRFLVLAIFVLGNSAFAGREYDSICVIKILRSQLVYQSPRFSPNANPDLVDRLPDTSRVSPSIGPVPISVSIPLSMYSRRGIPLPP